MKCYFYPSRIAEEPLTVTAFEPLEKELQEPVSGSIRYIASMHCKIERLREALRASNEVIRRMEREYNKSPKVAKRWVNRLVKRDMDW